MTRFTGDATRTPRVSAPEWATVAAGYSELTGDLTGRQDIVVRIAPDAANNKAPACWIPALAQIELAPDLFDGADPARIDATRPTHRNLVPAAYGAFIHECGHATHSRWLPTEMQESNALSAAMRLEESRMEHKVVTHRPGQRRWLRCAVRDVILSDIDIPDDQWGAGTAAALILARVDAGILDPDDVTSIETAVLRIIDHDTLRTLTRIWRDAQATDDTDTDRMLALGQEWCDALHVDSEAQSGPGTDDTSGTAPPGELATAVAAAAESVASAESDDAYREAAGPAPRVATDRAQQQAADDAAERVFGRHNSGGSSQPVRLTTRTPTVAERAAANKVAQRLRKARHRDRPRVVTNSTLPPGRLRGRAAMTAQVERARQRPITAEPFRRVQRRRIDEPRLAVGIAVDVSGSMRPAERPISSAAWILGTAVTRSGGTFSTVAYGSSVKPIVRPGERPAQVSQFQANHQTEDFVEAVSALDSALGLTWGTGVRLLIVVSDGRYTTHQRQEGQRIINRIRKAGCGVLWLHFGEVASMEGTTEHAITDDLLAAATLIGDAAVKAVSVA